MNAKMPAYTYVDTDADLRTLAERLANTDQLAIDTESNSLYAYQEQVCLIQLSAFGKDYIIDPLAIDDLLPLGDVLNNPQIEKILHAAEYDLMTLKRDYGFVVQGLFDTMIAARLVGHESFGLAALLLHYFGVKADKRHQRDDWGARPLSADSLRYAQMDTHYLARMRDELASELEQIGRLDEAWELFREAEDVPAANNDIDTDGFWHIGRPHRLDGEEMAILRALYLWREKTAAAEDTPTFKVVSNNALVNIAIANPRSERQLASVDKVHGGVVRRYGSQILEAVREGRGADWPVPPPLPPPPPPEIAERFVVLQQWRKDIALRRKIGSDMVVSKETLWHLARELPQTRDEIVSACEFGPRRAELYGDALVKVMKKLPD